MVALDLYRKIWTGFCFSIDRDIVFMTINCHIRQSFEIEEQDDDGLGFCNNAAVRIAFLVLLV